MTGTLYIVATPIGHLADITYRAVEVLQHVDIIAAEDTRHSRPLLQHYGIDSKLIAYHEHNESEQAEKLLSQLQQGKNIALISDAGTPLISDPGYVIVNMVRKQGLRVEPIPGCSAIIAALSAAGLPTDKFFFAGFLPSARQARQKTLASLSDIPGTLVFYESPKRVIASLTAMSELYGADWHCVVARELTKKFATFYTGNIATVLDQISDNSDHQRGEFVLLLHHTKKRSSVELDKQSKRVLQILLQELAPSQAAKLCAKITGIKKDVLYRFATEHESL